MPTVHLIHALNSHLSIPDVQHFHDGSEKVLANA